MFSDYISIQNYEGDKNENAKETVQEIRQTLHGAVSLVYLLPQTREDDRSGTWRSVGSMLGEET